MESKQQLKELLKAQKARVQCDECSKTFTTRSSLRLHRESIHEGVRYYCREAPGKCSKSFGQLGSLRRHIKSLHAKNANASKENAGSDAMNASPSPNRLPARFLLSGSAPPNKPEPTPRTPRAAALADTRKRRLELQGGGPLRKAPRTYGSSEQLMRLLQAHANNQRSESESESEPQPPTWQLLDVAHPPVFGLSALPAAPALPAYLSDSESRAVAVLVGIRRDAPEPVVFNSA